MPPVLQSVEDGMGFITTMVMATMLPVAVS